MQESGGSSSPDEGCVRRSSRKRRSPGEWWKEFPVEKRKPLSRKSSDEAKARHALRFIQNHSPTIPESKKNSNASEEPLRHACMTDEAPEVAYGLLEHGEDFRHIFASTVTKRAAEVVPTLCISAVGGNAAHESQTKACRSNSNDNAEQLDNDFESDPHEESAVQTVDSGTYSSPASQRRTISSLPTVILPCRETYDATVTGFSSHTGDEVGVSDKVQRKNRGSCHWPSGKVNAEDIGTPSQLTSQQDEGNRSNGPSQRGDNHGDRSEEKKRQASRSEHLTKGALQTCAKLWRADESKEKYISMKRSSRSQRHDSLDASKVRTQDKTPPASRKVNATGFSDQLNLQSRELSNVNAPKKSRVKPVSPCYTFSLRSRRAPQPYPTSMIKSCENQYAPTDENMEESTYPRQEVLVARRAGLRYNLVTGPAGTVKVAISISLNKCTIGEVVIPPRSATGPRRALTGDEFYIVKQGYVECDIGSTSVALSAGDHLGIPEGQCFEIRNPSSSRCELFFFSPKTFKNYSRTL